MSIFDQNCSACYSKPCRHICGCSNIFLCEQCKDIHMSKRSKACLIQNVSYQETPSARSIIESKSDSIITKLKEIKQSFLKNNCLDKLLNRNLLESILNLNISITIPDSSNYIYYSKADRLVKKNPEKVFGYEPKNQDYSNDIQKKLNLASCIVPFNEKIALFGGFDDEWQQSKIINCYSTIARKWEEKFLKKARSFPAGVFTGNYLFIIGGMGENRETLRSIEIYDENLSFCKEENTKYQHLYPSATIHQSYIYILSSDAPEIIERFHCNDSSFIEILKISIPKPSLISSNGEQVIILCESGAYDLSGNCKGKLDFKNNLNTSRFWSQQEVTKSWGGLIYFDYFSHSFGFLKLSLSKID